jgi:mono/diheme cytochrome c family protein
VQVRQAALFLLVSACFSSAVLARQATSKGNPEAAKIKNPIAATPESVAAGKKTFDEFCAGCHGVEGAGGMNVAITEDKGLPPPPALNDDQWDHGSTDGEIFAVIQNGMPPDFIMGPWKGRIPDNDQWNVINYLRSVKKK